MPAIAFPWAAPNPGAPHAEPGGKLSGNGYNFLRALWNRTGAGTGIVPKVSGTLTATGSSQADALKLTDDWNQISEVPGGSGVVIQNTLKPGQDVNIWNNGAGPLNIYPFVGAAINALGTNVAYSLPAGRQVSIQCFALNQFKSILSAD